MNIDPDTCYAAILAKDRRFDGWFFVGVSSTGVYCRPVCPVRPPKRRNCRFYATPAAAEKAGFRPCMRCRPELAPGHGLLDLSGHLAGAAATLIEQGLLNDGTVEDLARRVGVTERHLRRIFSAEFGVSITEFAQTQRLLLAKRLLTDTALPVSTVASAAGFGSVRRFNAVFVARYEFNPLRLRKGAASCDGGNTVFTLTYRPPFGWAAVMRFLAQRQIHGVEHIDEHAYARTVEATSKSGRLTGWLSVKHLPQRYALGVTVSPSLTPVFASLLTRVRRLFDLDCRPDLIDTRLGELAADLPGLRVPGAFDGVEIAVRAIVEQRHDSARAGAILSRVAARFGTAIEAAPPGLTHAFPSAAVLADLHPAALQQTGIARPHAEAIVSIANAVVQGAIALEPMAPLEPTLDALRAIPGVEERAVQSIAMRSLGWPNAFPADDAILLKHTGHTSAVALIHDAARWEPWRAYATLHMWRRHETTSH
nr:DNA-3-methyladenine glycosylase 2 family protein [Paraburkholderia caballeronis]